MTQWKIAAYLRLSNDDRDKDESDSIATQRRLIQNYIAENLTDGQFAGEYVDDGFTGLTFDRPDFRRMMHDINRGLINCVIVKDLSRFGRDYIEAGNYLEKIFPENDIRFIAVNDNYDSLYTSGNDAFIAPLKNIFNSQYSKDISAKVKSSFSALQSEGKFCGAFAGYGYVKDPHDRHRLVIDETAAQTVREVFDLYLSGMGKIAIANHLNRREVPSPSLYKQICGLHYTNGQRLECTRYWTYSTIDRMLKNEMYIGNMVQNKTVRKTVRGKAHNNPRPNWKIVENTHPAIIKKEKWDAVQELLKRNTRQLNLENNVGLFAGFILCGDCGRAMTKVKAGNSRQSIAGEQNLPDSFTYLCGSYKRYSVCSRHAVKSELLEKALLDKINTEIAKLGSISVSAGEQQNQSADTKKYELRLVKLHSLKKSIYEDYREGLLTKEEYLAYKEDYQNEGNLISGQLEQIRTAAPKGTKNREWLQTLTKYGKIDTLDREMLAEILDRIIVTETEEQIHIEFRLKFLPQSF
ncbi:MAG: recombinase family protein [Clostridiales bacterium]|nr:recombinase family protein [Clostridiales bacterium]